MSEYCIRTYTEFCMPAYKNIHTDLDVHEIRKFIILRHWIKLPNSKCLSTYTRCDLLSIQSPEDFTVPHSAGRKQRIITHFW